MIQWRVGEWEQSTRGGGQLITTQAYSHQQDWLSTVWPAERTQWQAGPQPLSAVCCGEFGGPEGREFRRMVDSRQLNIADNTLAGLLTAQQCSPGEPCCQHNVEQQGRSGLHCRQRGVLHTGKEGRLISQCSQAGPSPLADTAFCSSSRAPGPD